VMAAALMFTFIGLVVGLTIGVTVSLAGFFIFELLMCASACAVAFHAYVLIFHRRSSSVDVTSYVVAIGFWGVILLLFLLVVRCSQQLNLDAPNRCVLFSVGGVLLGLFLYGYVLFYCQEDERKHHLGLCGADGEVLEPLPTEKIAPRSGGDGPDDDIWRSNWEALARFGAWILSWQWWFDLQDTAVRSATHDEEATSGDLITVHNRTLKLVKVCLYSPDDLFCWTPYGGIGGRCVGLIRAEERRSFLIGPRRGPFVAASNSYYQLKVFQPGFLDKELACYSKVQRGQSFAFFDVEGMVKRSRLLSFDPERPKRKSSFTLAESSEDEIAIASIASSFGRQRSPGVLTQENAGAHVKGRAEVALSGSAQASPSMGSLMKRNHSSGCLNPQEALACGDGAPASMEAAASTSPRGRSTGEAQVRRAAPDEVVIRNRSNQEIRALVFRSNDYCYLVPLVGKIIACGDIILPANERRFNPKGTVGREFTLKVYSVGPGAKELTYLTVSRGHTYTFCDSLLS